MHMVRLQPFTSLMGLVLLSGCAGLAPGDAEVSGTDQTGTSALSSTSSAPVDGGTYNIVNAHSGLVLDVSAESTQNGAQVWQWGSWGGTNQQWKLVSSQGAFELVNVNSQKCLEIKNGNPAAGAALDQWDCWNGANQQWHIQAASNGTYTIANVDTGMCLDVWNSSVTNGGAVSQYSCWGGTNQAWTLQAVGATPTPTPTPTPAPTPAPTVSYANPLNMTFDNEPALANGAAPYNYVYTAPGAGTAVYGSSGLPQAVDVRQGYLGDCYFMSSLSVIADRYPTIIHDGLVRVSGNSDGSSNYLVRMYAEIPAGSRSFKEQWVPTSDRLYMQPNGTLMGAQGNIRWAAIYEKAFAKLVNITHQVGPTTVSGYECINEGGNYEGFEALTGIPAMTSFDRNAPYPQAYPTSMTLSQVLAEVNNNSVLTSTGFINADQLAQTTGYNTASQALSLPSGATVTVQNSDQLMYDSTNMAGGAKVALIAGHVFGVLSTSGQYVLVRNPWGSNPDDQNNANGEFWIDISDLQILSTLSYVVQPAGMLGVGAAPHTR